jgi:LacI family gluconate utilization system Gnt-I transcriptional repressor
MASINTNPSGRAPAPRQRRGHGRVTLEDVAELAGVTSITVSRFLREPGKVAEDTARRIRAALRKTGYVPNKQAGQLASGQSRMVAAIIPSIAHSIFAETVQGLSDGLQAAGYELLLASTGYSMEREEEQLRALLGWFPSALVVTGRHHTPGALKLLRQALDGGTPVIEIWDQHPVRNGFVQVGFEHAGVGRAMAAHLLDCGYRSLAYVDSSVAEDFRAHERGEAFVQAAQAAGASAVVVPARPGDAFEAGRQALHAILARGRVDAVAFANDHLACGALLEAAAVGVAVPRQLGVMGFGDFPIGRQLTPALSTIRPPRHEIGTETARQILGALQQHAPAASQALPWALEARASTAARQ